MKSLVAALLLAIQPAIGEIPYRYENAEKLSSFEYIIKNPTVQKSPEGTLPISFSAFQQIGSDYKLLGDMSQDLNKTKLVFAEPTPKSYIVQDLRRTIFIDTVSEEIQTNQATLKYIIDMRTDNCLIAVNFNAFPDGSNTVYYSEVFVRPGNWGTRALVTFLSLIPTFDNLVEAKINDITKTSETLFQKLRENPDDVYKTRISDEKKEEVRKLFN